MDEETTTGSVDLLPDLEGFITENYNLSESGKKLQNTKRVHLSSNRDQADKIQRKLGDYCRDERTFRAQGAAIRDFLNKVVLPFLRVGLYLVEDDSRELTAPASSYSVPQKRDLEKKGRRAALARLRRGIEAMSFRSTGPYPSRDELHDRT